MIYFIGNFNEIEKETIQDIVSDSCIVLKTNYNIPNYSIEEIIEFIRAKEQYPNIQVYLFDKKNLRPIIVPCIFSCKFLSDKINSNLTIKDTTVYIHQGCSESCLCTSAYKKKFSVPYEYIKKQINSLPQKEYISLYAINVGDYNSDNKNIIELCKSILSDYPEIKYLVLGCISPYSNILPELMEYMSKESRILPYLHICLNTASKTIAELQGHSGTEIDISKLSKKYKINLIPYIIAGYPKETEKDFQDTLDWIERTNPYGALILPYIPNGVGEISELNIEEYENSISKLKILNDYVLHLSEEFNNDINKELLYNLLCISVYGEDHLYYERIMKDVGI